MSTHALSITITDAARRKISSNHNLLRISVDSGGCSGMQYMYTITNGINQDDTVLEDAIVIDEFSAKFLNGCEVDFVENLAGGFFRIINPKAKKTCGCGNSFDIQATDDNGIDVAH